MESAEIQVNTAPVFDFIPLTEDQYEDVLFYQELEAEQAVLDWEAPFPMTERTQADMAENRERIVREGIARFARLMTSEPAGLL